MQPQVTPIRQIQHGFSNAAARKERTADETPASLARHAVSHILGNGFYLEETPLENSNDCVLTVRCRKTRQPCPHVLAAAISMDLAEASVRRSWLPEGMDVLARLRAVTCYHEGTPRLVAVA